MARMNADHRENDSRDKSSHYSLTFNRTSAVAPRAQRPPPWAGRIPPSEVKTAPECPATRCARPEHRAQSNASSLMTDVTSPAMPAVRVSSCSTITLLVFSTVLLNCLTVKRLQSTKIYNLKFDAILRQCLGGFERNTQHGGIGDHADVADPHAPAALFPGGPRSRRLGRSSLIRR